MFKLMLNSENCSRSRRNTFTSIVVEFQPRKILNLHPSSANDSIFCRDVSKIEVTGKNCFVFYTIVGSQIVQNSFLNNQVLIF